LLLAAAGAIGAFIAFSVDHGPARSPADQDWEPFALVAGLLLVGLVADEDRVFSAVGTWMARRAKSAMTL
jgi:Na+/H+ antiporter NhaD/arsenite permease-like protein